MELSLFDLIILALATWRISRIVTREDGPFGVFSKWRAYAKARQDMGKALTLYGLLSCIYCLSVWVALGLLALHLFVTPYVSYVFAVSGLALMLRSYTGVQHG
jgi:hypothetical protein